MMLSKFCTARLSQVKGLTSLSRSITLNGFSTDVSSKDPSAFADISLKSPINFADLFPPRATQKHKIPTKRASKLLFELNQEEFNKVKKDRNFPFIKTGDSIQIEKLEHATAKETDIIKGVVTYLRKNSQNTSIGLLNVEYGTPVLRYIEIYSPLVKDIKILQKQFITQGKKRVKKSRLYNLVERNPELYTVN